MGALGSAQVVVSGTLRVRNYQAAPVTLTDPAITCGFGKIPITCTNTPTGTAIPVGALQEATCTFPNATGSAPVSLNAEQMCTVNATMKLSDGTAVPVGSKRVLVKLDLRFAAATTKNVDNCLVFSPVCTAMGSRFLTPVVGDMFKNQSVCYQRDANNKVVTAPINFDVPLLGNWFGYGGDPDACRTPAMVSVTLEVVTYVESFARPLVVVVALFSYESCCVYVYCSCLTGCWSCGQSRASRTVQRNMPAAGKGDSEAASIQ